MSCLCVRGSASARTSAAFSESSAEKTACWVSPVERFQSVGQVFHGQMLDPIARYGQRNRVLGAHVLQRQRLDVAPGYETDSCDESTSADPICAENR